METHNVQIAGSVLIGIVFLLFFLVALWYAAAAWGAASVRKHYRAAEQTWKEIVKNQDESIDIQQETIDQLSDQNARLWDMLQQVKSTARKENQSEHRVN